MKDHLLSHPLSVDALCTLPVALPNVDTTSTILTGSSDGYVRAVRILPTKMLGVVADHGDWPVERISIGCGMGQLSIEPEEDKSAKIAKNKQRTNQDETIGAEQRQRWWVGSVGHDDTLRMTDLEGFFREAEQAETGKGALAADIRDDDSDTEVDEKLEEDSQEKPEIAESDSSEQQQEAESSGESDVPPPKKRKRKAEKNALNTKKHKGKNSITVERSFFDGL
jgi:WD repeat-containing protein 55